MQYKYRLGRLIITTSEQWKDITDSVEGDDVPSTLARNNGAGALQFSVAEYVRGEDPRMTLTDLDDLRQEYAENNGYGNAFAETRSETGLRLSAGSYKVGDDYMRLWYGSDGQNLVFMTYTANWGDEGDEPRQCEAIAETLDFDKGP